MSLPRSLYLWLLFDIFFSINFGQINDNGNPLVGLNIATNTYHI